MANVTFKSNAQIEAQEEKNRPPKETQVIEQLASHIRMRWQQAQRSKNGIEQQFLSAKRRREGTYEPAKLAAIKQVFGADYNPVFFMLTETKCRAAEAIIKDIVLRVDEEPWDIHPTPIPDLPDELDQQLDQMFFSEMLLSLPLTTDVKDLGSIISGIKDQIPQLKEEQKKKIKRLAKEAVEKMKELIQDQFAEGNWKESVEKCIHDLVTYGICFLKGPTFVNEERRKHKLNTETGKYENNIEKQIIGKWERRSPFDIYPAPDSLDTNDGYVIDKISFEPQEISDLIGVEGFSRESIIKVLTDYRSGGLKEWTSIDTERADLEQRESMSVYDSEKIDCLHYMGSAPGYMLREWGLGEDEIQEPFLDYDISAYLIGIHVIKAMINPDPLGKKPIYKACLNDDPDSFWGRGGIPALIEGEQDMCNAVARAWVNNVAIASGPLVEIDKDRLAPGCTPNIHPWKIFLSTNNQMREGKAVEFYQPDMNTEKLIRALDYIIKMADENSGIPRYAHGQTQVGGGGDTASGLSMLFTMQSKNTKMYVKNLDNIIVPSVERQYYYNLDYEDIELELIGDVRIIATGSSSMIAKEQQAVRRTEFLTRVTNPLDSQIIGISGRKYLLEETAKSLDIDVEKLFEEYELEEKYKKAMIPMNQMTPAKPYALNEAGDRQGGVDFNTQTLPKAQGGQ